MITMLMFVNSAGICFILYEHVILQSSQVKEWSTFQFLCFLTAQAIHDGMNCKQYQEQVKQESETNAEARRTKEMLEVRRCMFVSCSHSVEQFGSASLSFIF
jgi:hypothetical protein